MGTGSVRQALEALNLEPLWDRSEGGLRPRPEPIAPQIWRQVLTATPPGEDGARVHDYVDPALGDVALPTLDCRAIALSAGTATTATRSSANAVCLVLDGEGETEIDGETLAWRRNDLFTLPHWRWVSHRAQSSGATLMAVSDRPALRRLGLLQENSRP